MTAMSSRAQIFRANYHGGTDRRSRALISGLRSNIRCQTTRVILSCIGEWFDGPNDPVKCGHHQQPEDQSKPTHLTQPAYGGVVKWSTKIEHLCRRMIFCTFEHGLDLWLLFTIFGIMARNRPQSGNGESADSGSQGRGRKIRRFRETMRREPGSVASVP